MKIFEPLLLIIKRRRLCELDLRLSSPRRRLSACSRSSSCWCQRVLLRPVGFAWLGLRFALDAGIQLGPGPRIDAKLGGREVIVSLPAIDRRSYARGLTHCLDLVFKLG